MLISKPSNDSRRRGFTLIEILVVVAIIALLISILLPSLQRARDQAKSLVCLSNLKQIGTTMSYYSSDNKMKFLPPFRYIRRVNANTSDPKNVPGWWQYLPYRYLFNNTKITECPKDDFVESSRPQFKRGPYADLKSSAATIYYSYAINAVLPKQTQPLTKSANDILPDYYAPTGTPEFTWYIRERYNPPVLSAIKRPSDTVFMLETREGGMLNGRELHTFYRRSHGQDRDSMNIIMTDSHAELRTFKKVWAGDFSTSPPANLPVVKWSAYFRQFWWGDPFASDIMLK